MPLYPGITIADIIAGYEPIDANTQLEVSFSPNPISSSSTLEIRSSIDGAFLLKLYNLQGQLVLQEIYGQHGSHSFTRGQLNSGLYHYTLEHLQGRASVRGRIVML